MAKKTTTTLDATIRNLKAGLKRDLSRQSAADVASLQVDCLDLLYRLKLDQATLHSCGSGRCVRLLRRREYEIWMFEYENYLL